MTAATSTASLGVIVVRGKLDKLRELPLGASTTGALRAYLARREGRLRRRARRRCSFPWRARGVAIDGVEQTFSLLRDRAGVPSRDGRRPTVHGLRHTFAIRTMLDAYRDGADAGARLGVLSTYLGHVEPGEHVLVSARRPGVDERRG